ncbi:hypothetical protein EJB05_21792, partial [Eragrostis curvula]
MRSHAHLQAPDSLVLVIVLVASAISGVSSKAFTVSNNCGHTVWPGILSSAGSPPLDSTGFALAPGESRLLPAPSGWSGRLWGRTLCSSDVATGRFSCATGDCGSGRLECAGSGAAPPATLAEFTLDGHDGLDFYDVSLVDGYNLPMLVTPQGAAVGSNCVPTGCVADLNGACPAELRVASASGGGAGVACKSACEAFGSPEHCCSGEYGNPNTCRPSAYSQFFKNACPRAYSYAYDDATSTFTCGGGDTSYAITFCPSSTSVKAVGPDPQVVVYFGGGRFGSSAAPRLGSGFVLLGVALLALARFF